MTKILDIWCWNNKTPWAVWLDYIKLDWVDIVHNLDVFPYPFSDNEFDKIYSNHVMEHLNDIVSFMKEIYRIGKPWAKVFLRTPHASCTYSTYSDPTHKRWFTTQTFEYFNEDSEWSYYTNTKFKIITKKLHFICYDWKRWSRIPSFFQKIINFIWNLNLLLTERIWAWWIWWFEEVYVELEIIK